MARAKSAAPDPTTELAALQARRDELATAVSEANERVRELGREIATARAELAAVERRRLTGDATEADVEAAEKRLRDATDSVRSTTLHAGVNAARGARRATRSARTCALSTRRWRWSRTSARSRRRAPLTVPPVT